jgi:hypothetical protein
MTQPTNYQCVKLGSTLEYLVSVCAASVRPTSDLTPYPNLIKNLPPYRYSPTHVLGALKTLFVLLRELGFEQSLQAASAFQPMVQELEAYLQQPNAAENSFLHHPFAERIVVLAKQVHSAVRSEMNQDVGESAS